MPMNTSMTKNSITLTLTMIPTVGDQDTMSHHITTTQDHMLLQDITSTTTQWVNMMSMDYMTTTLLTTGYIYHNTFMTSHPK